MKKTTLIITAVLTVLYLLIQHGRHLVPERESGIKTLLDQIPRNSQINERQRSLHLAAVGLTEMIPVTIDAHGQGQAGESVPLNDHAIAAASDGEALWVLGTNSIQHFGRNLELKARVERDLHLSPRSDLSPSTPPYNREGALDVASGMAFVSVDGMLRILGNDGHELGCLELSETAQNVIVRDGTAYMISSAGEPLWAHKVDVSDPEHPSITREKEIFLENGQLGVQWVDTQ